MATAQKDTVARERTVTHNVTVVNVTLEVDEARLLYSILRNVGGPRDRGRKHADAILAALDKAGVGRSLSEARGSIIVDGVDSLLTTATWTLP